MRISDWSSDVCSSDLGIGVCARLDGAPVIAGGDNNGVDAVHDAFVVGGGPIRVDGGESVCVDDTLDDILAGEEVRLERRSEEHTSELQSLMRISYAVFCLKKKTNYNNYRLIYREQQRQPLSTSLLTKIYHNT